MRDQFVKWPLSDKLQFDVAAPDSRLEATANQRQTEVRRTFGDYNDGTNFNFSAGPAVLPVPVLEQAQRDMLLSLPGIGMSVMEISHRSKPFDEIINGAEAGLRELLGVPEGYHILFLQGGASLQFSMMAMNLLPKRRQRRLHPHRQLGQEGSQGSKEVRQREYRGHHG